MKNLKRILAIIGIIVIVGLYVITLILAVTNSESTQRLFIASIVATVVVPCLLYIFNWVYGLLKK